MIKIFTDSEGIKETTNQLLTELNYYTGCLEAVKQIANKDDIISLNELEADILKGTNFSDVNKVAELRGCYDAYKFFKDYHNKYDLNNYTENLEIKKEVLDQAIDNATSTMRRVRKLSPVKDNNFGVVRSDDLINRILGITKYLGLASWLIGVITVLGSSIALMNIMIVSVTERTREIGVRKALGAKKSTIAFQFFIETLLIGQLGGLVGIIFGILIGFGIATAMDFAFVIPWGAIMAAFITSFIVAIVSGLYPAIKAAVLDPIEALRYE